MPAHARSVLTHTPKVAVPWLSALELSMAYHDGRIDPVWLQHNGLTVRGGIVAMTPEIFDGIHAVVILAALPTPVRLWFQKDDPAVRRLAVGHPVTAHCSLGAATLDSVTLYDCHVLGSGVRLGRDIWADIEMGRPIK